MVAQIKAGELYRIIWNALLFVDKNSETGPVSLFAIDGDTLSVSSADAYSGLIERTTLDHRTIGRGGRRAFEWYMGKENLQEISKKLKVQPNETIDLMTLYELGVTCSEEQVKAWQDFHYLTENIQASDRTNGFSFGHSRLKLLYRIRLNEDLPIDFQMSEVLIDDEVEQLVEFFIGDDIRGYVAPLESAEVE